MYWSNINKLLKNLDQDTKSAKITKEKTKT